MTTKTQLTTAERAALKLFAERLVAAPDADAIFDVLLEELDAASERRKERWRAERAQAEAERKKRQMEYWRNCQRGHTHYDQCSEACATPLDRAPMNLREEYDRYGDPREISEAVRRKAAGHWSHG